MLRTIRRVIPLAVVLTLFIQADAFATQANVSISNFAFTPALSKLKIGDSVKWTNTVSTTHTTTSDAPFSLWNSGNLGLNGTYTWPFNAAGIFPYHCNIHPSMHGNIGVRGYATPASGVAGTQFTVNVSAIPAPPLFVYDIQKKNPGGQFVDWMLNVTTKSVTFDSTGQPTGQYQFRSRLKRISDGTASNYSPASKITVT
jgi:plastocyanin